jgi:AcrR family transcriptional regulator
MDLPKASTPARRRRGKALEDALLDAAWAELVTRGYGGFTMDAVADRANTSRPVLYRRWSNREDLVLAAIRHSVAGDVKPLPDTGSLRGDVIALLTQGNESRPAFAAVISTQLGAYYAETQTTPAELRAQLIAGRTAAMDILVQRAVERGEVDPARLTPRITALPVDLLRHEVLMTLAKVPMTTIVEIVDDVFLPLVAPYAGEGPES